MSEIKRANEVFPDDDWVLHEDPHDVIPVGVQIRNEYTVVFFTAHTGGKLRNMMVGVKYEGSPAEAVYSTTLRYLSVLRDYFMQISHDEFVDTVLIRR